MQKSASHARVARRPVHGVILLDKPIGYSSNQALLKVKWLLRANKAGHTGTLDPLATGVLPLCFGAATKFAQVHLEADKAYKAIARLGVSTTTADSEGEIIGEHEVSVTPEQLQAILPQFRGEIWQLPPMYSALKHEGKALYEYAREGIEIKRPERKVFIHALGAKMLDARTIELDVRCSKGTYIRTLGSDIGNALGCGAHLISLQRTATGNATWEQCITLEALEAMTEDERMKNLKPPQFLLQGVPEVFLEHQEAGRFLTGMRRPVSMADAAMVQVMGKAPEALLGVAHIQSGELIPDRLLSPIEIKEWVEQNYKLTGEMK